MTDEGTMLESSYATPRRAEEDTDASVTVETWELIYVGFVLIFMFAALLSDRIGVSMYRRVVGTTTLFILPYYSLPLPNSTSRQADLVMLAALTACMAANIITVAEGLSGFSNEGVLTVLVLFVVAAGIQVTGGLGT